MTTPTPTNPLCGHPLSSQIEIVPGTLVCLDCQNEISRNLILTLQAQTENMRNCVDITDEEVERLQ